MFVRSRSGSASDASTGALAVRLHAERTRRDAGFISQIVHEDRGDTCGRTTRHLPSSRPERSPLPHRRPDGHRLTYRCRHRSQPRDRPGGRRGPARCRLLTRLCRRAGPREAGPAGGGTRGQGRAAAAGRDQEPRHQCRSAAGQGRHDPGQQRRGGGVRRLDGQGRGQEPKAAVGGQYARAPAGDPGVRSADDQDRRGVRGQPQHRRLVPLAAVRPDVLCDQGRVVLADAGPPQRA